MQKIPYECILAVIISQQVDFGKVIQIGCELAGEYALEEGIVNPNRKIREEDFLAAIKDTKSSLEIWAAEAEKKLKRNPEISTIYPGINELIQKMK